VACGLKMEDLIALAKKVNKKIDLKTSVEVISKSQVEAIPKKPKKKSKKKRPIIEIESADNGEKREEGGEEDGDEEAPNAKRTRVEVSLEAEAEEETRNDYPYPVNPDDHCETKSDA
jgi:hypothetical protein